MRKYSRNIDHLVFWQPNVGIHSGTLYKELLMNFTVTLCVIEPVSDRRKQMGYSYVDNASVDLKILSHKKRKNIELFDELNSTTTLHLFSGTRGYASIWKVLKRANKKKAHFSILSETPDWIGIKGKVRKLVSKYDAYFLKKNVSFILGIGPHAIQWFSDAGYPEHKLFEWAYFSVKEVSTQPKINHQFDGIQFIYVGRFIKVKGIDWLIQSFLKSGCKNFILHLVGKGPLEEKLKNIIPEEYKSNFNFHGHVDPSVVKSIIANMDYLILPSTGKDGWGAVVNESLSEGIPCIVSENAGSTTLINNGYVGYKIDPKRPYTLLKLIKRLLTENKKPTIEQRKNVALYSRVLTGASGAQYLKSIIENTNSLKLSPPWKLKT